MARRREQIVLELKKLRSELKQADEQAAQLKRRRIDEVLDERLEQKGAHKADCSCWECMRHVSDVLTRRRVAEMDDPRGIATPGIW